MPGPTSFAALRTGSVGRSLRMVPLLDGQARSPSANGVVRRNGSSDRFVRWADTRSAFTNERVVVRCYGSGRWFVIGAGTRDPQPCRSGGSSTFVGSAWNDSRSGPRYATGSPASLSLAGRCRSNRRDDGGRIIASTCAKEPGVREVPNRTTTSPGAGYRVRNICVEVRDDGRG
jgi:hypothetical protein